MPEYHVPDVEVVITVRYGEDKRTLVVNPNEAFMSNLYSAVQRGHGVNELMEIINALIDAGWKGIDPKKCQPRYCQLLGLPFLFPDMGDTDPDGAPYALPAEEDPK